MSQNKINNFSASILASDFVIALVPASNRKFVGVNSLPPLPSSV